MNNFDFYVPTAIHFGKGQIEEKLTKEINTYGKKVLLVYGGGSIKKIGLYDRVMKQLEDCEVFELSGVEPNPRMETVDKGAKLCKEHHIDVILAVGGGSTIDCAKVISATAHYEKGRSWDLVMRTSTITKTTPLITILTLSATGSEMNCGAVISNIDKKEKKGVFSPLMFPKASFLEPENTFTVSKFQTASGTADIMSHVMESYFHSETTSYITDQISISILKCCIQYGPIAIQEPSNYEARANLMWASTLGINGITDCGVSRAWSCHAMEHPLSAYDDITHGAGLAVLTPRWMRYILDDMNVHKFAEFGIEVWGIDSHLPAKEIANKAINALEEFFISLGLPDNLEDLGVHVKHLEEIANSAVSDLPDHEIKGYKTLTKKDVLAIYKACLKRM